MDESAASLMRPSHCADTSIIKANQVDESCRKCQGKVYEMEQMATKYGVFHKKCFTCEGCKKSLESTLSNYFEAREKGVYCTRCFKEKYGDNPPPHLYYESSKLKAQDGKGKIKFRGLFQANKYLFIRLSKMWWGGFLC